MSTEYPKILSPFMRHTEGPDRHRLDPTRWVRPELELLSGLDWAWTEKVHGTNVRVIWDGHRVTFGGRTDTASMPTPLLAVLRDMFPEELLEQQFGSSPAVLYGEGYGPKIVKGSGLYRNDLGFVLFDVRVSDWWLLPDSVAAVAKGLGVGLVPTVLVGSIWEAVKEVSGGLKSAWGDFPAEGVVGRLPLGLMARDGDRLLVKIKTKDFVS